ncbi:MAG: hypothetical protein JSR53_01655 [Proteobacteria bacterium]|nr:hypothetical protein [Pseudomonadota bacterium]
MSLFSWFTRKSKPQAPRAAAAATAAAGDQGKPLPSAQASSPQEQLRRGERGERRELLYTAVRDAMVRAGVLSAGYKFKVLSLDQRGSQFLVMMDLAPEFGADMARLCEIETLIAQSAKTRFGIGVPAVYWRTNAQIVVGSAVRQAVAAAPGLKRVPEFTAAAAAATPIIVPGARPVVARQAAPAPGPAAVVPPAAPEPPLAQAPGTSRFEPIEADEVAAFKQALVSAAARTPQPPLEPGVATRSGPRLPASPVLTGFEDTVMPGQDGRGSDLSSTQYGDLR